MKELFVLVAHLLATLVKLAKPGGARAVAAESLTLKHQFVELHRIMTLYLQLGVTRHRPCTTLNDFSFIRTVGVNAGCKTVRLWDHSEMQINSS